MFISVKIAKEILSAREHACMKVSPPLFNELNISVHCSAS